jgi:hypothetical protein
MATTPATSSEMRARLTGRRRVFDPWGLGEETKPFFLTSEFWVAVALVIALFIATSGNIDAPLAWTLVTVVSAAYVLSRGLAKSGSRHFDRDR